MESKTTKKSAVTDKKGASVTSQTNNKDDIKKVSDKKRKNDVKPASDDVVGSDHELVSKKPKSEDAPSEPMVVDEANNAAPTTGTNTNNHHEPSGDDGVSQAADQGTKSDVDPKPKSTKKSSSAPKKTTTKQSSTTATAKKANGTKPGENSGFSQYGSKATDTQKNVVLTANDWQIALSDEGLADLMLEEKPVDPKFAEAGFRVINKKTKKLQMIRTSICHVKSSALHGVGVKSNGKYQHKITIDGQVDEETDKEDPSIKTNFVAMLERIEKLKYRIGELVWDHPKVRQMFKKQILAGVIKDLVLQDETITKEKKHAEFVSLIKKAANSDDPKLHEKLDEMDVYKTFKDNPEVRNEAIELFVSQMGDWKFGGNATAQADDPEKPCLRLKAAAFFPKKKDADADNKIGDTSTNSTRTKKAVKPGAKQVATLTDDSVPVGSEDHDIDGADDENESSGWNNMSLKEVNKVIQEYEQKGFRKNKFTYKDAAGYDINVGKNANNPNFRYVDQNDYVVTEFSLFFVSLTGDTKSHKIKLNMGNRVWIVKQGTPDKDIPQPIQTTIVHKYVPRDSSDQNNQEDATKEEEQEENESKREEEEEEEEQEEDEE